MQQRRFHRVTFSAPATLMHHDLSYRVRLENICLRGALFSSAEFVMVRPGETCEVAIAAEEGKPPLLLTVEVVHSFFSMAGVKFTAFGPGSEEGLYRLMQRITPDPELLRKEWDELQSEALTAAAA